MPLVRVFADDQGFVLAVHNPDQPASPDDYASQTPNGNVRSYLLEASTVPRIAARDRENSQVIRGRLSPEQIEGYVEPPPASVGRRQFFQGAARGGLLSQEEALGAMRGEVPASLAQFIETLPEEARFTATMKVAGATDFRRDDPMISQFASGVHGMSESETDDLFRVMGGL